MLDVLSGLPDALMSASLIAMAVGTAAGILVGATPGLTATLAMALLLPFTYTMAPLISLGMMAGIYCGSPGRRPPLRRFWTAIPWRDRDGPASPCMWRWFLPRRDPSSPRWR